MGREKDNRPVEEFSVVCPLNPYPCSVAICLITGVTEGKKT